MKYPNRKNELGVHTDCRGTSDYNKKISISYADKIREDIIVQSSSKQQVISKIGSELILKRNGFKLN